MTALRAESTGLRYDEGGHVQSGPADLLALVRRYYQAYENDDRSAIEQLLQPDFTFTSPQDDRIDRAAYFERCWPPHERIVSFTLFDVCADAHGALVRYRAAESAGPGFANVEHFEFAGDRISHVDVYFGRELS
jgi:ketosteroid isomerase-like protein